MPAAVGCHSIHVPDVLQVRPEGRHGIVVYRLLREVVTKVVSAPAFAVGGGWRWEGQAREGKVGGGSYLPTKVCYVPGQVPSSSPPPTAVAYTVRMAVHRVHRVHLGQPQAPVKATPFRLIPCSGPLTQSTRVGTAYLSERLRDLQLYTYMSMI